MDFVRAPTSPTTLASPRTAEGAAPAPPEEAAAENAPIRLILGGYSYGSLIASRLPSPPSALLAPFLAPAPASPAAAIVTRARDLAARTTAELLRGCEEVVVRKRGLGAVVVGGDADAYAGANANATAEGSKTAASRPSRKSGSGSRPRSLDLKNAVGRRLRRYSLGKHPSSPTTTTTTTTTTPLTTTLPHINITTAFLLLSPLLPPTSLAIAPGFPRFRPTDSPALLGTPGLAVYGDRDVFTSAERLAGWVGALRAAGGSKGGEGEGRVGEGDWGREGLEGKLIKGAGHFWIERGVLVQLVRVVGAWAGGLEG
ncbi:uncharacterized protein K452DRAFT_41613 [Aplosporella prunicola CBS 121167]|uniref:AB hydrolase-1 domain-containing protein n=1 Tax=Aplosporella prunicola CBS 121167 TaxID=1176127 RepID=A0A6A6B9U4_9PEZI|nr:uncharacterized protein K452DRAFT_41613 [Aplosporella prunicola CBS 121167]KAF2140840.1 hypothetical protein K452DRAFT_41613 [Aplosporella prunicola CBS 121167]